MGSCTTDTRERSVSNSSRVSGISDCEPDEADPLHTDADTIREQIEYCCLLLEVEVTEFALRALSIEILNDKGPLPVGEIGKLLQEITSNANLSAILKVRHSRAPRPCLSHCTGL